MENRIANISIRKIETSRTNKMTEKVEINKKTTVVLFLYMQYVLRKDTSPTSAGTLKRKIKIRKGSYRATGHSGQKWPEGADKEKETRER